MIVEGGLQKWSISLSGSSVRGTWRHKRRLWRRAPLSIGASLGNLEEDSYDRGLCVEDGSGTGVSTYRGLVEESGRGFICQGLMCGSRFWDGCLHIGAPLGNLGRGGVHLAGTLRIS